MVDMFLMAGCPGTEIADAMGIWNETLYRACQRDHNMGFDAYAQQKKSTGKARLRAKQYERAMKGSETMLIYLGKSMLGQTDRPVPESDHGGKNTTFTLIEELIENEEDGTKDETSKDGADNPK
jgi:hypothetical protein